MSNNLGFVVVNIQLVKIFTVLIVKLFGTYHSLLLLLFIIYVLLEVLTFSFCVSSPDELQFDPTVSSGHFGQLGKRQRKTAG